MKSALIYDCLSLKKISAKLPVKLKNLELIAFKCAIDNAMKSKISLDKLKLKKIDPTTIKMEREIAFFRAVARSSKISLGDKSCLALAFCAHGDLLLVANDGCILNIASAAEISFLKV